MKVTNNEPQGKVPQQVHDLEGVLSDAQTGKGSRGLSASELEMILPVIAVRGLYIPAMECYQRETENNWPLRMDLSLFWEEPETAIDTGRAKTESMEVVREILEKIRMEGKKVAVLIWLDDSG